MGTVVPAAEKELNERGSHPVRRPAAAVLALAFVLVATWPVHGDQWVAFSTGKARGVALGGAQRSAEDDLFSALWNPASFGDARYLHSLQVRAFLSPTTTAFALRSLSGRDTGWHRDDRLTEREAIFGTMWGIKGVTLGWRTWVLGFINLDEALRPSSGGGLSGRNALTGHAYTLALAFRLAPQVVLGASATRENRLGVDEGSGWGGAFGVLLRPSKWLNVGLTYDVRPAADEVLAGELERVGAGTINGGVSIYPWDGTAAYLDLRNLDNSRTGFGFAEPHIGIEQSLFRFLALRAGWYHVGSENANVYSAGIGIRPFWLEIGPERPGRHMDLVSYTFLWQRGAEGNHRWHMLALIIPVEP